MGKHVYEIWQKEDYPEHEPRLVATLKTKAAVLDYLGWSVNWLNERLRYKDWSRNIYGIRTKVIEKSISNSQ